MASGQSVSQSQQAAFGGHTLCVADEEDQIDHGGAAFAKCRLGTLSLERLEVFKLQTIIIVVYLGAP